MEADRVIRSASDSVITERLLAMLVGLQILAALTPGPTADLRSQMLETVPAGLR